MRYEYSAAHALARAYSRKSAGVFVGSNVVHVHKILYVQIGVGGCRIRIVSSTCNLMRNALRYHVEYRSCGYVLLVWPWETKVTC